MWLMAALYLAAVSLCSSSLRVLLCSASITCSSSRAQRKTFINNIQVPVFWTHVSPHILIYNKQNSAIKHTYWKVHPAVSRTLLDNYAIKEMLETFYSYRWNVTKIERCRTRVLMTCSLTNRWLVFVFYLLLGDFALEGNGRRRLHMNAAFWVHRKGI